MAVPELIVSRDRLIELVQDGRTPEQIAGMFRVDTAIIREMIRRLEQNGTTTCFTGRRSIGQRNDSLTGCKNRFRNPG